MKYFICEGKLEEKNKYNASNKPREDVEKICTSNGYERLYVESEYGVKQKKWQKPAQLITYLKNRNKWKTKLNELNEGDTIFFQYPLLNTTWNFHTILKKYNKKINIVVLVHDLDSLRYTREISSERVLIRKRKEDKHVLNNANYIIAHNYSMKNELVKLGNDKNSIFELNLFDYLMDDKIRTIKRTKNDGVIIAGCLDKNKAKYLTFLNKIKGTKFNLYGVGYEPSKEDKNVCYKGKFLPEELLNNLDGGFGLVWDGISKDTCTGGFGNYLRYNNPHKASMYLTAKIPIITWKNAAIAKFVEDNKVGITVDSLDEISDTIKKTSDKEYQEMVENTKKISEKTTKGKFLKEALEKIEKAIQK